MTRYKACLLNPIRKKYDSWDEKGQSPWLTMFSLLYRNKNTVLCLDGLIVIITYCLTTGRPSWPSLSFEAFVCFTTSLLIRGKLEGSRGRLTRMLVNARGSWWFRKNFSQNWVNIKRRSRGLNLRVSLREGNLLLLLLWGRENSFSLQLFAHERSGV